MASPEPDNAKQRPPADRGELAFIRRLRPILAQPLAGSDFSTSGLPSPADFDDMTQLVGAGAPLLWTTDMLMDGVDFDSATHSWKTIGRKAMAVNLSDCAAMGVQPMAALCAVALANTLTMEDALDLVRGAHECGLRFGCPVSGGDTNSWDAPTVISIAVAAQPQPDVAPVRRAGARPGDTIWVTGPLGGSILGRHLTFEPRIRVALDIARRLGPHAMIDVSDGLVLDLWRILEASGCGAVLEEEALDRAIHADAVRLAEQDGQPPREHALYDGEDFELIVVLPSKTARRTCQEMKLLPLGRITTDTELLLENADGQRQALPVRGWEHFQ